MSVFFVNFFLPSSSISTTNSVEYSCNSFTTKCYIQLWFLLFFPSQQTKIRHLTLAASAPFRLRLRLPLLSRLLFLLRLRLHCRCRPLPPPSASLQLRTAPRGLSQPARTPTQRAIERASEPGRSGRGCVQRSAPSSPPR